MLLHELGHILAGDVDAHPVWPGSKDAQVDDWMIGGPLPEIPKLAHLSRSQRRVASEMLVAMLSDEAARARRWERWEQAPRERRAEAFALAELPKWWPKMVSPLGGEELYQAEGLALMRLAGAW
ncbi:MAG: hypothetical protein GXY79_01505 [Chloroflexi bacterium]|nr:hypothetical protein [Chloroflexota bacterium]